MPAIPTHENQTAQWKSLANTPNFKEQVAQEFEKRAEQANTEGAPRGVVSDSDRHAIYALYENSTVIGAMARSFRTALGRYPTQEAFKRVVNCPLPKMVGANFLQEIYAIEEFPDVLEAYNLSETPVSVAGMVDALIQIYSGGQRFGILSEDEVEQAKEGFPELVMYE